MTKTTSCDCYQNHDTVALGHIPSRSSELALLLNGFNLFATNYNYRS
jgi:hypothetical protein